MKIKGTIRLKSFLFISVSILLSSLFTYHFSKELYIHSDEKQIKTYISQLLTKIGNDMDHIEESLNWTQENLNLTFYVRDDTQHLLESVTSDIDDKRVLSDRNIQQLKNGNTVINKIKTHDFALDLLLFIHPIIKENKVENLLFLHIPANNIEGSEGVFAGLITFFAILFAVIMLYVNKKIFEKSWNKFEDIKLATVEVSKGNFDAKIHENSKDEFGELTVLFNVMSKKLKDEQNRAKEFMEDFSHEVKTPLTLVKNYNQSLMDNIIQTPEEQQKCYRLIDRQVTRMQKLIQNFLDFTKLNAQSIELIKNPIVFAQTVEDIMDGYELVFKENNVKLDMELNYDVIISADEDRLEQIIQNIVHNAIKYSKKDPHIRIKMERNDTTCVLAISDNGVGISEENLFVISNRFIRVNKVRSRKEDGTGLGLSIVEKLMELHEGKMIIESQLGVGTTVKLEFPVLFD